MDEDGFIKAVMLTGHEQEVYTDSVYKSTKHNTLLKQKKIKECITHRAYRNRLLTQEQEKQNRYFSSIRTRVDRVFGSK